MNEEQYMTDGDLMEFDADTTYTAEVVARCDPEQPGACDLSFNGNRISWQELGKRLETFEGWKIDFTIHE
jgi:hypothetical protein